ncbi:unknown protein [Oryza sativa Japonica Group]|uniref:Os01g0938400 protein n=6 Tax=Oryza TaxID=4527 RepID=A0A0P0VCS1_ORYSJ|nr:hypothetical protein OsI_05124 [Oryza sativa Indica Group]KAB8085131.1 hypothetical protein EE612_007873 [Oryza sativa]BAD87311.1 unknown protein [Oryza sativa Japonica Group]BAD87603.1 unknown protein [Oryza sativa Japonica Group]BAF07255.2 Os01g0938400 [Oryza sativa Japonica Group]|eukprot:NP_001045341.2 Os01g0938400 [Oryza sativa Japonica Group]
MPSSYLMSRRFSYRRLKKLPTAAVAAPPDVPQQLQEQYYAAITAAAAAAAQHGGGGGIGRRRRRRMRPRLRISRLARVLRRKAAAVGGAVRASVAKVVRRLREGSPYVGDLFAGNYMFMQVTPSPTMAAAAGLAKNGVVPYYHHGIIGGKNSKLGTTCSPSVMYKVKFN